MMCARGREAQLLAELAQSKGETYDAAVDFPHLTTKNGFEFSTAEINRLLDRNRRLHEARVYRSGLIPERDQAQKNDPRQGLIPQNGFSKKDATGQGLVPKALLSPKTASRQHATPQPPQDAVA